MKIKRKLCWVTFQDHIPVKFLLTKILIWLSQIKILITAKYPIQLSWLHIREYEGGLFPHEN